MNECGSVQRQNAIATENNDYAKLVHFELIESNSSSAITGQNMFFFFIGFGYLSERNRNQNALYLGPFM